MGLRFSKRIQIIPGVRLNWSLGGPSLSVGARGASVTMGKRGVYGNVGIPGTGLSYRTKLGGGRAGRSSSSNAGGGSSPAVPSGPSPAQIAQHQADNAILEVTPDGTVSILAEDGSPLEARALRLFWDDRAGEVKLELDAFCRTQDTVMDALLNVHGDTQAPQFRATYQPDPMKDPAPARPAAPSYPMEPTPTALVPLGVMAKMSAHKRAEHAAKQAQMDRDHRDAVQQWLQAKVNIDRRHAAAVAVWNQQMAAYDTKRAAHDREQAWIQKNFRSLLTTNPGFMERALEDVITSVEWPLETTISYLVYRDCSAVDFDIDLPEIDDFPDFRYQLSKDQRRLLKKAVSATERARLYERYIHGAILRVAGIAFSTLPEILYITVSGYTQRTDPTTGNLSDDYVISARIPRNGFESLNFAAMFTLDPIAALRSFELRSNRRGQKLHTVVPFPSGSDL